MFLSCPQITSIKVTRLLCNFSATIDITGLSSEASIIKPPGARGLFLSIGCDTDPYCKKVNFSSSRLESANESFATLEGDPFLQSDNESGDSESDDSESDDSDPRDQEYFEEW